MSAQTLYPLASRSHTLEKGEIIFFFTTFNTQTQCLFGLGDILQVKSPEIFEFQWYGSLRLSDAQRLFLPKWVHPIDNKGPYAKIRILSSHPPWTILDTASESGVDSI